MNRLTTPLLSLALLCGLPLSATAENAENTDDSWQFSLTPYLWLPRIDGTLRYDLPPGGGGSPNVSVGPTDWLKLLNAAALLNGSASKGKFSLHSDFVYLSLTSKNDGSIESVNRPGPGGNIPIDGSLNLDTRTDLDGIVWSIDGGYTVQESDASKTDIFVGVRYFGIEVETRWDLTAEISIPGGGAVLPASGNRKKDTDLWDGIIGVRGHFALGDSKWSAPYSLDVGTGSSDLTWNAVVGVARAYDWGDFLLAYRHLAYDQGNDDLLEDFSFSGPAVGATFHF